MSRHIISFPIEDQIFNYRVAAIIVVDGHILVCKEDDDHYVMLPGGRVELGEASATSLAREIEEEIAMPARIGEMVATSESFYTGRGETYHELGFFFRAELIGQGPNGQEPWLTRPDEGHLLKFYWVPLDGDALERFNLMPPWLPEFLRNPPNGHAHIVHDERLP
ncbi:MAG: NUDIX domain-containing protein [Phyllobacteriaceae bacterium]|nr:NUDIX domain-containing protein [Phyllobacteriaceae bacterium]